MYLTNAETVAAVITGMSGFMIAYMEFRANRVASDHNARITVLEHQVDVLEKKS